MPPALGGGHDQSALTVSVVALGVSAQRDFKRFCCWRVSNYWRVSESLLWN